MRSLLALLFVTLSGCATQAHYQAELSRWVGHPADDVVIAWGPPASTYALGDGGKVMEWYEDHGSSTVIVGGIADTAQLSCRVRVTSSAAGVVRMVGLEGNRCRG